jgi:hypothetical protein
MNLKAEAEESPLLEAVVRERLTKILKYFNILMIF